MSKRRFPPELRTASVVPRWSIVWTLTRDVLTNHSFYVVFYAHAIAKLLGWKGDIGDLMYRALVHDLDETISGDICAPVKREIIDDKRAEEYIEQKMRERLPCVVQDLNQIADKNYARFGNATNNEENEAWAIIKAADRLDALLFLIVERRMGNGVISSLITSATANLEASWRALPASKAALDEFWNTTIMPVIREHDTTGGYGI